MPASYAPRTGRNAHAGRPRSLGATGERSCRGISSRHRAALCRHDGAPLRCAVRADSGSKRGSRPAARRRRSGPCRSPERRASLHGVAATSADRTSPRRTVRLRRCETFPTVQSAAFKRRLTVASERFCGSLGTMHGAPVDTYRITPAPVGSVVAGTGENLKTVPRAIARTCQVANSAADCTTRRGGAPSRLPAARSAPRPARTHGGGGAANVSAVTDVASGGDDELW